jgi:hypothetical protein
MGERLEVHIDRLARTRGSISTLRPTANVLRDVETSLAWRSPRMRSAGLASQGRVINRPRYLDRCRRF